MLSGSFYIYTTCNKTNKLNNRILASGVGVFGTTLHRDSCRLGLSNSAVTESDDSLDNLVASQTGASDDFFSYEEDPFAVSHYVVYDFGVLVSDLQFNEVGIGDQGTLLSKAKIKDVNGFDTTLKINAGENLVIVHGLRLEPSTQDVTFVNSIKGTDHTFTIRPALLGNQTTWRSVSGSCWPSDITFYEEFSLGAISSTPTTGGQSFTTSAQTSSNSSDSVTGPVFEVTLDIDDAPFSLSGLEITTTGESLANTECSGIEGRFQISIDPPIDKQVGDIMTLRFPLNLLGD